MTTVAELNRAFEDQREVLDVETKRSISDGSLYIACEVELCGTNLHDLHEKYDFEVRSVYNDPTTGNLRYAVWPGSSEDN